MTTATQAYAAIRARLESQCPGVTFRWQNEDAVLPDDPAPFVYVEFVAEPGALASFGGGRGANRYRNPARVEAMAFVPRGQGLTPALDLAETVAAALRSYRDVDISCFDATVMPGGDGASLAPPGLASEAGNYWFAAAEISLHFDLIG